MSYAEMDPREAAKAQVKAAAEGVVVAEPDAALDPPVPPSLAAAQERQAARIREATVARWLRRLSS